MAQNTTKLPHPIELEGDWEVALTEISVPVASDNVTRNRCSFALVKTLSETFTYGIKPGYDASINMLMNELNNVVSAKGIRFGVRNKKVKLINESDFAIVFNSNLARKLGFNPDTYYSRGVYIASDGYDLT